MASEFFSEMANPAAESAYGGDAMETVRRLQARLLNRERMQLDEFQHDGRARLKSATLPEHLRVMRFQKCRKTHEAVQGLRALIGRGNRPLPSFLIATLSEGVQMQSKL
ncbi:hypothetical protein THICB2_340005 [Thiomonas sp. CB2]|nr:hypothetical protein THICB2_340005 [Thiomonas sp. CB2]